MYDNTCKFLAETFPTDFVSWIWRSRVLAIELGIPLAAEYEVLLLKIEGVNDEISLGEIYHRYSDPKSFARLDCFW